MVPTLLRKLPQPAVHRAPLEHRGLRSCVHRSEHINEYEPPRMLGGSREDPIPNSEIGVLDKVTPGLAQLEKSLGFPLMATCTLGSFGLSVEAAGPVSPAPGAQESWHCFAA